MKVWLPYVVGGSGTDTFTQAFASALDDTGHVGVPQPFAHNLQLAPDLLRAVKPPNGTDIALTNSLHGFGFKRSGIPMVAMEQLCVHDPAYAPFRSPAQAAYHNTVLRWYGWRTLSVADRVVAVSNATRAALAKVFPEVEATVIHNGVDTDFFTPAPKLQPSTEGRPFRLLFIGNLTNRKGADLLPKVMQALGPKYELEYTSGLRGNATLDVDNARSLGSLDREGVRSAIRGADAFLFPTRLEGLPLAVLEAMACGLPVIGSDQTSMPEVVEDGVTGILRPLDAVELAGAIEEIALDDHLRVKMSAASRKRATELFGLTKTVQRYVSIFEELI